MTTPNFVTPDFSPFVRLMTAQAELAIESSREAQKLMLMPWQIGLAMFEAKPATETADSASPKLDVKPTGPKADKAPKAKAKPKAALKDTATKPEPAIEAAPKVSPAKATQKPAAPVADVKVKTKAEPKAAQTAAPAAKSKIKSTKFASGADDLRQLKGLGPKMAQALCANGVTRFEQIGAWSDADLAEIDTKVAGARARAEKFGWVAQAASLAK